MRGVPVVRPLELLLVVNVAFLFPVSSEPCPVVLLSCASPVQLNSIGHFAKVSHSPRLWSVLLPVVSPFWTS